MSACLLNIHYFLSCLLTGALCIERWRVDSLLAERQTFQRAGLCPPQLSDEAGRAEEGGDEPSAYAHQSQT